MALQGFSNSKLNFIKLSLPCTLLLNASLMLVICQLRYFSFFLGSQFGKGRVFVRMLFWIVENVDNSFSSSRLEILGGQHIIYGKLLESEITYSKA